MEEKKQNQVVKFLASLHFPNIMVQTLKVRTQLSYQTEPRQLHREAILRPYLFVYTPVLL